MRLEIYGVNCAHTSLGPVVTMSFVVPDEPSAKVEALWCEHDNPITAEEVSNQIEKVKTYGAILNDDVKLWELEITFKPLYPGNMVRWMMQYADDYLINRVRHLIAVRLGLS